MLTGTFEDTYDQLPNNYFDLVICNDVIEHMSDHDAFFKKIKTKLTRNAHIVGSLPNIRYLKHLLELLIDKDWKYRSYGILDNTHLRFFHRKKPKKNNHS